jgi:hypothetical protein
MFSVSVRYFSSLSRNASSIRFRVASVLSRTLMRFSSALAERLGRGDFFFGVDFDIELPVLMLMLYEDSMDDVRRNSG